MNIRKRLLTRGTKLGLLLACASSGLHAQTFSLEGAVIDSRTSQSLGIVTERGELNSVFRAQKAMTFGILRSAGISLEQLPPEVRARIERFQTTNIDAFRAYSQGLDLKDQGRFAEAKEFFRRAAEIDPGFALAADQQRSMPDVNIGGNLQMRAVIAAAAGAAVDRGKASYVVDAARAVAAVQSGQSVIAVAAPPPEQARSVDNTYTSNPPGSGVNFAPDLVTGLSYSYATSGTTSVSIATANEWRGDKYRAANGILESAGSSGDFLAQRLNAAVGNQGNATLADGSIAYWGSWLSAPGASAAVTANNVALIAPKLGVVDYMMGDAPQQMPTSGTAVFRPTGGMLAGATGTIAVNFVTRAVALQNLGFNIGGLGFSGLNGSATYDARIASGAFTGNYTSGTCVGCVAFTPLSSAYGGNFIGRNADGLIFSTILVTGNPAGGSTASGVQLFTKP